METLHKRLGHLHVALWADRTTNPPQYARWNGKRWVKISAKTYQQLLEGTKK